MREKTITVVVTGPDEMDETEFDHAVASLRHGINNPLRTHVQIVSNFFSHSVQARVLGLYESEDT